VAVAFIPMFTMLGLARTTEARFASGIDIAHVVEMLASGSLWVFVLYTVLGVVLTLVLARTLTEPIGQVARALARIRDGEVDVAIAVESADELGRLQEGVNNMAAALRDRARILSAFGRVVEPAIRDRLLSGELHARGELRPASVLFVDLRGFTAMAEREPPGEVVATLNEFFTAVGAWVRECEGFVDKYIGDAALVVFGLFDETGDGSARAAGAAVKCATGICERLEVLNDTRRAAGKQALAVTVAVHSGDVLAGTIGAADRHEYTVIGDTVNVAARLQQVAKDTGDGLVVSRATVDLAVRAGVCVGNGACEKIVLRGRREPVEYVSLPREKPSAAAATPQPNVRD
jgi:adenylate cyclase